MADQKFKSARTIAVEVLNRCDPRRNYAGPVLDRLLHETDQRQKATDLVFGTMRNRGAIDTVIAAFSGRPVERIQDTLLAIIRIGVYELVYCPETQEYAIVNEAVEHAKTTIGTKQTGFVNAVLRQIIRHISHRQSPLSQADARRTLLQTASSGCEFDTDFLPDKKASPVVYLSTVLSLPEWLVSDWLNEYGEVFTRQICLASNRKPSITIRPNRLKTTTAELVEKLQQAGNELEISSDKSMVKIKSPRTISQLPGFSEGEFIVQDITASQPVRLLNPQPNWTILDLCGAPGVKTTQLAEATGDSAAIVATDINQRRLEKVKENIARLGIKSVDIISYEELPDAQFDCVLLDVPCSNTGVLAKRIEARYRISPGGIQALTRAQNELLSIAAAKIKPHGKICYSTCSIQKVENDNLIRDFLERNPIFELECEELILPSA
ncbi:transcription antitermination factor NusB [Planctomycetota bacterium]